MMKQSIKLSAPTLLFRSIQQPPTSAPMKTASQITGIDPLPNNRQHASGILWKRLAVPLMAFALSSFALADSVPALVNYQGRLTDASANNLPDGTGYELEVRVWSAVTGGTLVWGARYGGIVVKSGAFNLILGAAGGTPIAGAAVNDISFAFADAGRYIGLTLTKNATAQAIASPTELLPRQQVLSVPYATVAKTAETVLTSPVPSGLISMWSGAISTIPAGWKLCDGTNGPPDLRDRFVVGARQDDSGIAKTNVSGSLAQTGGEAFHTLTIAEIPAHTHSVQIFPNPIGGGNGSDLRRGVYTGETGATGGGGAHNTLPPYFALAFIMKQ
jgi:hypothetical protein